MSTQALPLHNSSTGDSPADRKKAPALPLKIELDFSLIDDRGFRYPSKAEARQIYDLFPTWTEMNWTPPFIVIVCKPLPPKPWPLEIAGMFLYLTDDSEDIWPVPVGASARGPHVYLPIDLKLWKTPGPAAWAGLLKMFDDHGVPVEDIQWTGWSILAIGTTVLDPGWETRFPRLIGGIRIGYIFGEYFADLEEAAMKTKVVEEYD
ncbi:MAG: hypothetical protein Q9220_005181 [cf. Caloplaca sp. 1 TL-2023]